MELTQFTDYSLRVLIYLGKLKDEKATIREISDFYRISENHLMKIIHSLAKKGYLQSHRGKGGGIRLAKSPDSIRVGKVVRDMEERIEVVECFRKDRGSCLLLPDCILRKALNEAVENFLETLDQYTLSDLLKSGKFIKFRNVAAMG